MGKELTKHFISRGYDVVAIGREDLELTDGEAVNKFFRGMYPLDAVFHCAIVGVTLKGPTDTLNQNLLAFENLKSHIHPRTKLVVFGSGAEFDMSKDIDRKDSYDLGQSVPTDWYGLSKYIITQRMIGSNNSDCNNCYVLRLFGCFGPTELDRRFIKSAIRCLATNKTFILEQDKYMDFFYIKDVLKVCEDILWYGTCKTNPLNAINLVYEEKFKLTQILSTVDPNLKYEVKKQGLGLSYTGRCDLYQKHLIGLQGGIDEMRTALL